MTISFAASPTKNAGYYIVSKGATVTIEGTYSSITTSNDRVARIVGNKVNFIGAGKVRITVKKSSSSFVYLDFFTWNVYLKNGQYKTYNDMAKEITSTSIQSKVYFACSRVGNVLEIKDYLNLTSINKADFHGKYLTSYFDEATNSSTTSYYEFAFKGKSESYTISTSNLAFGNITSQAPNDPIVPYTEDPIVDLIGGSTPSPTTTEQPTAAPTPTPTKTATPTPTPTKTATPTPTPTKTATPTPTPTAQPTPSPSAAVRSIINPSNSSATLGFETDIPCVENYYVVKYGSVIVFDSSKMTVTSADTSVAFITSNAVVIDDTGTVDLTVVCEGKTYTMTLLSWNLHVKKGGYYLYKDIYRKNQSGTISNTSYWICADEDRSLHILNGIIENGSPASVINKYTYNYRKDPSANVDVGFDGSGYGYKLWAKSVAPTATAAPTPTPTKTSTPYLTPSPTPTQTIITKTPTPTPTVLITKTPTPIITPTPTLAVDTPKPTPTVSVSHTPTGSPTPTPTVPPTPTPTPTPVYERPLNLPTYNTSVGSASSSVGIPIYTDMTCINKYYLVKNGSIISFDSSKVAISSSNPAVAQVTGNTIKILNTGTANLTLTINNKTYTMTLFSWNVHLKSGSIYTYTANDFIHSATSLSTEAFLICQADNKALRIENGVLASGSISTYTGKFLKHYYDSNTGTSTNKNFEYGFYNNSTTYNIEVINETPVTDTFTKSFRGSVSKSKTDRRLCVSSTMPFLANYYLAQYGSTIVFDNSKITITSDDSSVARVNGNKIELLNTGSVDLSVTYKKETYKMTLFIYNVHVKNAGVVFYKDNKCSSMYTTSKEECYLICSAKNGALYVHNAIEGRGTASSYSGHYIKMYYNHTNNTSTHKDYEFSFVENSNCRYSISGYDDSMMYIDYTRSTVKHSNSSPSLPFNTTLKRVKDYYPVKNGTTIIFDPNIMQIASSDSSVAKVERNAIYITRTGTVDLRIYYQNQTYFMTLFSWNLYHKAGVSYTYSDAAKTKQVGSIPINAYFIASDPGDFSGSTVQILNGLCEKETDDIQKCIGKYIIRPIDSSGEYQASYTPYWDAGYVPTMTINTIGTSNTEIDRGPIVVPNDKGQTLSNIAGVCLKYLHDNKVQYGAGFSNPPYKLTDGLNFGPLKDKVSKVDCVTFVQWAVYEYARAMNEPGLEKVVPSSIDNDGWYSNALKKSLGQKTPSYMDYFDVVYVAPAVNTNYGMLKDGWTYEKIKNTLKPGDILVYTGNVRHIDIFAGFSNMTFKKTLGMYIYTAGSAPAEMKEYSIGKPRYRFYGLDGTCTGIHSFSDLTAVLRIK
jgi:hypothetical protein